MNNEFNLNKFHSLERIYLLIIAGLHLLLHKLSLGGIIFQSKEQEDILADLNVWFPKHFIG